MEQVLIVSAGENANKYLASRLAELGYPRPLLVPSGMEARRRMTERDLALICVNAPLPDEFGHELCMDAADSTIAGVILLAKAAEAEALEQQLSAHGVILISKPFSSALFGQMVNVAAATHRRLARLRQENARLQDKLFQLGLVNRAKCLLIEKEHMTEADAHHLIEKQAMDRRCTRTEIAQEILDRYEPL